MAWKTGQSGNPKGRPSEKLFAEALRIVINEVDGPSGKRKLRLIAEKLVTAAIDGESWAIQQVADRMDGKPAQESTVTIDDKRDAPDWTRDELVALLSNARNGSGGTDSPDGRTVEPDKLH